MNLFQKAIFYVARGAGLGLGVPSGAVSSQPSHAGENVTTSSVLGLSAAWACVNLNAGTIGSLPVAVLRESKAGVFEEQWDHPLYRVLAESPNADQTPLDFMEFLAASIELQGNAFCEIDYGSRDQVVALDVPLTPDRVSVKRIESGELQYEWSDGGRRVVRQPGMLHIRGFGGSPLGGLSAIAYGRQTFGVSQAIERAAGATFRNGMRPSGALVLDKFMDVDKRPAQRAALEAEFVGTMNAGKPLILEGGAKWSTLTLNPDDAQMLESRQWSVEEVCRWFSTPPHLIGHTAGNTQLGSSIEQQTLAYQIFTLRRRVKRIEQAMEKQLLNAADRARGLKIRLNFQGLLRGDSEARGKFYETALRNGWMTINEVRALENLPPVEGGDVPRMQIQNVPITMAGEAPKLLANSTVA